MKIIVAALLFLLTLPVLSETHYYRWVDAEGRVHYSDSAPPENIPSEKMTVKSDKLNTVPGAPAEKAAREQQARDGERAIRQRNALADWQRRYDQALKALKQAEARLAAAKKVGEGDMVGSFLGGARPSTAWLENLDAAKKNLHARQQDLKQLEQEKKHLLYAD